MVSFYLDPKQEDQRQREEMKSFNDEERKD